MSMYAGELKAFEELFGPAGRPLSRLIRPAIAAKEGRTLVWGDWAAIEARVLPWLANTEGATKVLDVFRKSDADPDEPDLYMIEAANVLDMDVREMWSAYRKKDPLAKNWRQQGKVPVLSLGFGGAVGALQNMAVAYGVSLTEAEAKVVVDKWRSNNKWARHFWDALWKGFLAAMANPNEPQIVGRVVYVYDPDYMGGTVLCFLPDGRPLSYTGVKWLKREHEDKEGNVTTRTELTYRRGYTRRSLWYGVLAENITQAVAGSLLRDCLVNLSPADTDGMDGCVVPDESWLSAPAEVVGHTHDEIIAETDDSEEAIALAQEELSFAMGDNPDWAEGLPLVAEVSTSWYYTKTVD
ncbi:DNA polymerase [Octadecabacter Antarctic BD virus 1]|nr:DNA polymerase [Octadecabacter Antarctic BD virus 1]